MPPKPITPDQYQFVVDTAADYDRAVDAARSIKMNEITFRRQLREAREKGFKPRTSDQFSKYEEIHKPAKKPKRLGRYRHMRPQDRLDAPLTHVVAIGDVHDKPGRDKSHLRWISRFIAERAPDNVIQIGDFLSLDSLSQHEPVGSVKYFERPPYAADLESFQGAVAELNSEGWYAEIECDQTEGNHEFRADRAEEGSPNMRGTLKLPIEQEWARYNWTTHPYGEVLVIDDVAFVHVPFNGMGRDIRGEVPENQIANKTTRSLVFGHTHKGGIRTVPKIGENVGIEICNLGTAMPHGTIEDYATLSATGWTWGVWALTLQAGRIVGHHFVSMLELEALYD